MKFGLVPCSRILLFALFPITLGASSACQPAPAAPARAPEPEPQAPPTAEERARNLVERMTLDEKLLYLGGDRDFYIRPIKRLGIPEIKMADGPVGCRNWGPAPAYPASIAQAATFDPSTSHAIGSAIARDCRARGVHILLAPGVNIQRSPLNGRNFEYLGEDPYLARDQAVSFIRGVQEGGVMATVKHFAANNQEWDRHHVSSEVSERALNEIYFPAFEGAVKVAGVGAVMSSYNLLNGAYASHNAFLLRETLRKRWGFSGLVMSDWAAVYDAEGGVRGGTDLEMPRAEAMSPEALSRLLKEGRINEADIDEKVQHILQTLIRFGFLDRKQTVDAPEDDPKSAEVALDVARKSLVLLKNRETDGRPVLPLDVPNIKKIAVVGPNATPAVHGGSGSAYTVPPHTISLLEGIKALLPEAEVVHHRGITEVSGFGSLGTAVFSEPVKQEIFLGKELKGEPVATSKVDRINMLADGAPPAPGVPAENYSIRWTGTVTAKQRGKYQLMTNADDGVRVFLDGQLVIDDFSDHAPRMKETELELKAGTHDVVVEYFQGILGSICQFGFGKKVPTGQHVGENELLKVIDGADVVIVAVGYGQSAETNSMGSAYKPFWPPGWARKAGIVEAEDDDRSFALPAPQIKTIQTVTRRASRTVVVGFAGGGIDFDPWLSEVEGLLWAWYPGQEGGTAIAETLVGKNNPSGKLPVTFARRYEDHPAANSYGLALPLPEEKERGSRALLDACPNATESTLNLVHERTGRGEGPKLMSPYCEDVFVGYRGFDRDQTEPLFPFGFGLSYTSFSYSELRAEAQASGALVATLKVSNSGQHSGDEVVQIYVAPVSNGADSGPPRPIQQLAGFKRVHLAPGAEELVTIPLNPRALGYYQTKGKKGWIIPKGHYEVRASRSSRHHQRQTVLQLDERRL